MNALPQSTFMNSLASGPIMNTRQNIISGPGPRDYWFHSPGAQVPMVNEEGAFPVQGNIGSIIKQESTNFKDCIGGPDIGSSPNCTGDFKADLYTTADTCGSECKVKYPESYGLKDFGFPADTAPADKISNAHQIHAYANVRAGMPGQMANNGCYESIPNVSANPETGACELNAEKVYSTVGRWNLLPMYVNLQSVKYTPFKQ